MALNGDWVQDLLAYKDTLAPPEFIQGSDSGGIGRAWIDGALVVYDLEDPPVWLAPVLDASMRDENGDTHIAGVTLMRKPFDGEYVDPQPDLVEMNVHAPAEA